LILHHPTNSALRKYRNLTLLRLVLTAKSRSVLPFFHKELIIILIGEVLLCFASEEERGKKVVMTEYFIYEKENKNFALPVTSVLEIVETDQIEDLGLDLYGCVGGVVNREKLVPVFDSIALGLKQVFNDQSITTVIIVLSGDITFGLTMDNFVGVDKLTTRTKSNEIRVHEKKNKFVSAVVGYKNSTLTIFSPEYISETVDENIDEQKLFSENEEIAGNIIDPDIYRKPFTQFLCFSIDNINLAIPIGQVREIIEEYEVTPIFNVPALLRGLINLRGTVIACLDISNEIGLDQKPLTIETKYLIISYKESTIALCADVVHGMRDLYLHNIQKPDSVLDDRQQTFVQGLYEDVDKTLLLLSVSDIFETEHLLEYTDMTKISQ